MRAQIKPPGLLSEAGRFFAPSSVQGFSPRAPTVPAAPRPSSSRHRLAAADGAGVLVQAAAQETGVCTVPCHRLRKVPRPEQGNRGHVRKRNHGERFCWAGDPPAATLAAGFARSTPAAAEVLAGYFPLTTGSAFPPKRQRQRLGFVPPAATPLDSPRRPDDWRGMPQACETVKAFQWAGLRPMCTR